MPILDEVMLELRYAGLQLTLAFGHTFAVEEQLCAAFFGERGVQDLDRYVREFAVDAIQFGAHRADLLCGRIDTRAQRVELSSRVICVQECLVELGGTHTVV